MPRNPAHLEMSGGKPPRQRVWEAVRRLGYQSDRFTAADASRAAKVDLGIVSEYFKALANAGHLGRHEGTKRGEPLRYWLAKDAGLEAPRLRADGSEVTAGRGTEAMWQTMRHFLTEFDYRELAAHASSDVHPVSPATAQQYVQALARAGYLVEVAAARRGRGARPARYRLERRHNTGPRPPMIQRTRAIFDPNLGRIVWLDTDGWEPGDD